MEMLLLFKEFEFSLTGNVGSCVFVVLPPEEGVEDTPVGVDFRFRMNNR